MKLKKLTKNLKQFKCFTKCGDSVTYSIFTAILRLSYGSNFVLRVENIKYENGKVKCDSKIHIYYNSFSELEKDMQYHYHLCKNNYFTKELKITI